MSIEIKPMSLGTIFDRIFKLIGKTMKRNLIIGSIFILPVSIIFAFALREFFSALSILFKESSFDHIPGISDLSPLFSAIGIFSIGMILYSLVELFVKVATMHVASCEINAQPIHWFDAITITFKTKFLTAIGQSILEALAIVALFIIPYCLLIAMIFTKSVPLILICVLIFLASIGFVIYLSISWLFVLPVIASENVGVIESFRRSRFLVKSYWWRTLGIYLLLSIVASLAISMITTPITFIAMWGFIAKYFSFITSMQSHTPHPEEIFEILSTIGFTEGIVIGISAVLQLLITPAIFVVMYFDLRARKGEFGPTADGPAIPYDLVPPTPEIL